MDDSAVEATPKDVSKQVVPRLADVAVHAGVSPKTVSRVVNNEANVRPQVRAQVLRSVAALGYRPNAAARALVTQRTNQIGLVATASSLYGPTAGLFSLEQAAWKAGYGLTLTTVREASEAHLEEAIHYLMVRGVEGVIVSGVAGVLHLEATALTDMPLVSTSPITTESAKHVLVDTDQVAGTRAAVRHLYDAGHRRIAHLAGPLDWDSAARRREGWLQEVKDLDLSPGPLLEGDWSPKSGYEAALTLDRTSATAIVVANDHMAMGAIRAFSEQGMRIPDDMSVVGFDDVPEAAYQMVPLTTVRQNFSAVAERSVRELIHLIEGRTAEEASIHLPTELIVRDSTAPYPRNPS
ncbi:DNA-binding LacI/PurR family transcriptional regulator [Pseudarthrobacter defluvii]|uniref:LacI family DNA-binding transcriptional regulator n=1 Tax=Pseudarthrobacter defluvii TaxID=410837 RepID=UPI0027826EAE|nr:substrate-binding domain-containing protein [Pseudarthrobacter defluvii]MDQ0769280.1 DNA-binding LacI/PurR family transcriptional regulator [Pseudarthrobacter defluvii]